MAIVQEEEPTFTSFAGEDAEPELIISRLNLPSNATSIRADITDGFSCNNKTYGYYADVDNECQIFHVCLPVTYADGKENLFRWSFICPEETVFSQDSFTCMRREDMSIACEESFKYYELNRNFGIIETEDSLTHLEREGIHKQDLDDNNKLQTLATVPAKKQNTKYQNAVNRKPSINQAAGDAQSNKETDFSQLNDVQPTTVKYQRITKRPAFVPVEQPKPEIKKPDRHELFNGKRKRPQIFTNTRTHVASTENENQIPEADQKTVVAESPDLDQAEAQTSIVAPISIKLNKPDITGDSLSYHEKDENIPNILSIIKPPTQEEKPEEAEAAQVKVEVNYVENADNEKTLLKEDTSAQGENLQRENLNHTPPISKKDSVELTQKGSDPESTSSHLEKTGSEKFTHNLSEKPQITLNEGNTDVIPEPNPIPTIQTKLHETKNGANENGGLNVALTPYDTSSQPQIQENVANTDEKTTDFTLEPLKNDISELPLSNIHSTLKGSSIEESPIPISLTEFKPLHLESELKDPTLLATNIKSNDDVHEEGHYKNDAEIPAGEGVIESGLAGQPESLISKEDTHSEVPDQKLSTELQQPKDAIGDEIHTPTQDILAEETVQKSENSVLDLVNEPIVEPASADRTTEDVDDTSNYKSVEKTEHDATDKIKSDPEAGTFSSDIKEDLGTTNDQITEIKTDHTEALEKTIDSPSERTSSVTAKIESSNSASDFMDNLDSDTADQSTKNVEHVEETVEYDAVNKDSSSSPKDESTLNFSAKNADPVSDNPAVANIENTEVDVSDSPLSPSFDNLTDNDANKSIQNTNNVVADDSTNEMLTDKLENILKTGTDDSIHTSPNDLPTETDIESADKLIENAAAKLKDPSEIPEEHDNTSPLKNEEIEQESKEKLTEESSLEPPAEQTIKQVAEEASPEITAPESPTKAEPSVANDAFNNQLQPSSLSDTTDTQSLILNFISNLVNAENSNLKDSSPSVDEVQTNSESNPNEPYSPFDGKIHIPINAEPQILDHISNPNPETIYRVPVQIVEDPLPLFGLSETKEPLEDHYLATDLLKDTPDKVPQDVKSNDDESISSQSSDEIQPIYHRYSELSPISSNDDHLLPIESVQNEETEQIPELTVLNPENPATKADLILQSNSQVTDSSPPSPAESRDSMRRSILHYRMDPRKRRFLFKSDAS